MFQDGPNPSFPRANPHGMLIIDYSYKWSFSGSFPGVLGRSLGRVSRVPPGALPGGVREHSESIFPGFRARTRTETRHELELKLERISRTRTRSRSQTTNRTLTGTQQLELELGLKRGNSNSNSGTRTQTGTLLRTPTRTRARAGTPSLVALPLRYRGDERGWRRSPQLRTPSGLVLNGPT